MQEEKIVLTHKGTVTLTTPRLILRRLAVDDAQAMHENWAADEKVTKYLSWNVHESVEVTRELLIKWVAGYDNIETYHWAIVFDGTLIGTIGLPSLHSWHERCELGYCIGSGWWNNGLMTEAAGAVIKFAFEELNANKIFALHDTENIGSGRVMQKNGMTQEGLLREHNQRKDGTRGDLAYYSILKAEWETQREIARYNALPVRFDGFTDLPELSDDEIYLVCTSKDEADPEKKWVPAYSFAVCKAGEKIGGINLRIGYTDGLYYSGQIGYGIDEKHRGNGYAGRACRLIVPIAKAHGMTRLLITNDPANTASKRVCEKLGARFVRLARLPEWHDLYAGGRRFINIFEWNME